MSNKKNKQVLQEVKKGIDQQAMMASRLKAVASVDSRLKTLREWRGDMQSTLVMLAIHNINYFDVTPTQHLIDQISDNKAQGADCQAIVKWLQEFGKCTINKSDSGPGKQLVKFSKRGRDDINAPKGAKKTEWWSFRPSPVFGGMDLQEETARLIKKAEGALTKARDGVEGGDKVFVNADMLECLRLIKGGDAPAILAAFKASQINAA